MKLQISYDFITLSQALEIAKKTASFADIIEISTPLLLAEGIKAIEAFKNEFPNTTLLADAKIVDRIEEIVPLLANAGATYITVLYGTSNKVIQRATTVAHSLKTRIALDILDPDTMGQAAHDAKMLHVDHILFHYPHDVADLYSPRDQWEIVRGNTELPIWIEGKIDRKKINDIIALKPQGVVIGEAITQADDPAKEAEYFKTLLCT